jgi:hypothetical protein
MDKDKFYVGSIFGEVWETFDNREDFQKCIDELNANNVQFSWHDPELDWGKDFKKEKTE